MKVLVIGGGAREHALVCRLSSETGAHQLVAAPGNPGIATLARIVPTALDRADALVGLAAREQVDLTVVGPELPLSFGVADAFARAGRPLVGPTQAAARLETSKAYAKAFMHRHGVPTARFRTCHSADEALAVARRGELGYPLVLKADGLAAGKGVVIAEDQARAEAAIQDAMVTRRFGAAGACLVLEECLTGPEVSFFAVCDGTRAVPIGTAQDHKRIFDGDRGPNTGGMGAFAPSPLVDAALAALVMRQIVEPVVGGMAAEGCPYAGFLYVGLMLTPDGPSVIEFNVRLGDPEAQVILSLIADPLIPILAGAATGSLPATPIRLAPETRVGVVLASRGYPESSESDRPISGVDVAKRLAGVSVFHAGTAERSGQLVTAGGRVLTVVGQGDDYATAIERAYAGVGCIAFEGMQYRRDIGHRAMRL
jgi:phosphoribosylamine--glycine ligase